MAIYRGTGVTGTGGESDFVQLAQDAQAAAAAALVSENNAETAEVNAELAETNAETAAINAASSASSASTSATNAASSATAASNSASTATTQATNAANSATAAATSASSASTSATNAANSATSAGTSASTATTQATNASNSATAAATSATNAASSASTATTQATNASNSASTAATSATNASNSASAASTSATNASNSASSASTSATNAAASAAEAAATLSSKVSKAGDTMTGPLIVNSNTSTDALRITQTGSGNALLVEDSANPDSTSFVIDGNGFVVVGGRTSYPIAAGGAYPTLQVQGTTASSDYVSVGVASYATGSSGSSFQLSKSRSGTFGTYGLVSSGDIVGRLQFNGDDGTAFIAAARIQAEVDGTPGAADMPGRLMFSTTKDGASSPTEAMRINSSQNVSIGGAVTGANALEVLKSATGAAATVGFYANQSIQSDSTNKYTAFVTNVASANSNFAIGSIRHFESGQATLSNVSAGGSVTNQYGFLAGASLTGATNNYGFYSNIASGTGRWNFYAAGSADNYFAGNVGIGVLASSGSKFLSASNRAVQTYTASFDTYNGAAFENSFVLGFNGSVQSLGNYQNFPLAFLTNNTERMRIDSSGNLIQSAPTTAPTLSTNGTMVFNLTSNTNLRVSVRGSDGVTRTANITLA